MSEEDEDFGECGWCGRQRKLVSTEYSIKYACDECYDKYGNPDDDGVTEQDIANVRLRIALDSYKKYMDSIKDER